MEVKEEWEKRLKLIQSQYELDLKRKRDQKEQKVLLKFIFIDFLKTSAFINEYV
jgi:hypothetical protein